LNSKWAKIHPESVPEVIKQVVGQTGAELFFGGYDKITDDLFSDFETTANTTFLVGQNFLVKDFYHKIKLIPFGETLPFGFFNQYLSRWVTNISFFASGDRETVFKTKNDFYFISPICYEILFSQFMRRFYQNNELYLPHFMINVTNDSWYRMPEQVQHKFLAHWRAIEFGIPIIRATNTGITSILYPDGKESEQIGIGLRTSKDFQFTFKANPSKTFFVSWGIYGFIIFWLVLILVIYFWKNLLSTNRAS
jgi:apolipoprotein N-acyltransferase